MRRNAGRWALYAAALGVLLATGAMASNWRTYQRQYLQQSPQPGRTVHEVVVTNPVLGINDRCISCHQGMDDPKMRDAAEPLRTHPGQYLREHPAREFGCTICHRGNGNSLDEPSAHGQGTQSALLQGDLIQTRCAYCHEDHALRGAPALTRGYELIQKIGCTGCHKIEGFKIQGPPCPSLKGVGSKVNYPWLRRWLMKPKSIRPATTMPDMHFTEEYAGDLAAYLMSLKNDAIDSLPPAPQGDSDEGGRIVRTVRCITCHAFNGRGGFLAPDLSKIGNEVNRKWLYNMLKKTHDLLPGAGMPQFNFTDQEAADVTAYLFEKFTDYDLQDELEHDTSAERRDPESIELGRRIFKEMHCANCHAGAGDRGWTQLGPVLTGIGSRRPGTFNFGNSDIPRTTADYIFEKVLHPRAFATNSNLQRMPDFHLSENDAKDIALVLLSSRGKRVTTSRYVVPPKLPGVYEPTGETQKLFAKYQCFSCHSIHGHGYNLAYDLTIEGSRVRRPWLAAYLKLPYSMRPILPERMPVFHMSSEEAATLADYIESELTDPAIDRNLDQQLTPTMVVQGSKLFTEMGCMACHMVGDKGGYVGPSFTAGAKVGDKLRAGWVYRWLKNPQALVPTTIDPNYRLTDAEAKALTAYLMSIREKGKP